MFYVNEEDATGQLLPRKSDEHKTEMANMTWCLFHPNGKHDLMPSSPRHIKTETSDAWQTVAETPSAQTRKRTVAPAMDTADAMQLEQTHDGSHTLVSDTAHTEDRGRIVDAITLGHTTQKS